MKPCEIRNVAVLGTGMMGPGIALLFARAGYVTRIWGPDDAEVHRGRANFGRNVDDMVREGFITSAEAGEIVSRTEVTGDLEEAAGEAGFISEAILENLEMKQDIFARLESICRPEAILTSTTSTLLPSFLNAKMKCRERMLVAHFWNPAHLVPLVEVCGSPDTSGEAVESTMEILAGIGKEPVLIKKEILGFIGNRLMHAMNREAVSLVEKGVIDPEDIDRVILASFGPRFANLGLLEYLDYIGLDLVRSIQGYLYGDLDRTAGAMPLVTAKVARGELGAKSGRGFFDWSSRNPDDVRARRDEEFVRRLKEKKPGPERS